MSSEDAPEGVRFIHKKPPLKEMEEYFGLRISKTGGGGGLNIGKDEWGNRVWESRDGTEYTLAGQVAGTLIMSREGERIVKLNPGILPRIARGEVISRSGNMGGAESTVYRIELETKDGSADFALKYIFPEILWEGERVSYLVTSGVVAMRLMQMASKERPIPYVEYAVPVLATHDMTLAPFLNKGVPTFRVLEAMKSEYPDQMDELLSGYDLSLEEGSVLERIRQSCKGDGESFVSNMTLILLGEQANLVDWVSEKVDQVEGFRRFGLSGGEETSLISQSTISLSRLGLLFDRYLSDKEFRFNAGRSRAFRAEILRSIALVEIDSCIRNAS